MAKLETREKIIQAAYLRFYEFGYNGTSVQDIVDVVGVQKGTFYNHFKSKELLALEALKLYACKADQLFLPPEALATGTPGGPAASNVEGIRGQFEQAAHFHQGMKFARGCLMGNFTAESDDLPASFKKLIKGSFGRWSAAIAVRLRRAQQSGEINDSFDPEQLARYLMTSWQGALLLMKQSRTRGPIDDFFLFTFDVLLKSNGTQATGSAKKLEQGRKKR